MNRWKNGFSVSRTVLFLFSGIVVMLAFPHPSHATDPSTGPPSMESPENRLSSLPHVFVRRFRFEGNTAFSDEELSKLAAPYLNREISSEELQTLRRKLTLHYVDKGYINSGVIIPDQPVTNGVVTLRIIEGKLTKIDIVGNKHFRSDYVRKRLMLAAGPPVNVYNLQQTLQRLEQDPRIKRINAEFSPGVLPGESELKITLEENRPYQVGVELGNTESPSIGSERAGLILAHQNLTGNGDILAGNFGITEGLYDIDVSYLFPVTAHDTTLRAQYRRNESTVLEEPFEHLDIESRTETYGITVRRPFYRKDGREFALGLTGERRHSETFLLGRHFSFSPGTEEGESDVTVFRLFQEWIDRNQKQVIAARSTFNIGVDAFGATDGGDPNGKFFSWLGQFQWIRRLGATDWQTVFRTDMQLSADPLLPLEKFSVGGMDSVRGYREDRLVRDNGVVSSLELRIPVFHNKRGETIVQLAPFYDFGASWNTDMDTPKPKTISSAGLGLRWTVTEKIFFTVYGGLPFRNFDDADEDLQDKGVHFRLTGFLF